MATEAITGVQTLFQRWNGATWESIAEVRAIIGPTSSKDVIDITSLDTTEGTREFTSGFINGGTVSLAMSFTREGYELMKSDFEDDLYKDYAMIFPDADQTTLYFYGLVEKISLGIFNDDKIDANIEIQVTGEISESAEPEEESTIVPESSEVAESSEELLLEKYIYVQSSDPPGGLHCISLEDGTEKWWFDPDSRWRGHTPAVDQANGWVYYMCNGRVFKLDAFTGAQLDYVAMTAPAGSGTGSGNTLLVDDSYGYFIACVVNDYVAFGGAVRVFDENLTLVWEDKPLNINLKTVMAYHDGVLYVGKGMSFGYPEQWDWYKGEKENATITAYDITDGTKKWVFNPDPDQDFLLGGRGFIEVIYCNGHIIAPCGAYLYESSGADDEYSSGIPESPSDVYGQEEIYVLNAETGELELFTCNEGAGLTDACAPAVVSGGRLFIGSLQTDGVEVYQIGVGDYKDFNGYGHYPQFNHNVAHPDCLQSLNSEIEYVGMVDNPDQGGVIIDGIAYFVRPGTCTKFNADTLEILDSWSIGNIYDSTPLMVKNKAGNDVLLIKTSDPALVSAYDPTDGTLLWQSAENMPGNLFFCMNYYEVPEDASSG